MLKRLGLLAFGVFIGVVVGVACTYALMHRENYKWFELQIDHFGISYANKVFAESDIPLPDLKPPHGQAKFVDRGIGKGRELGFVVRASMDKLDKSKLPEKYKKSRVWGNLTIGPTESVAYNAHLEFTLKDVDGFELMTTKSEPLYVLSGDENKMQGFATDSIPDALIRRTTNMFVRLVLDNCETCQP
jgi:hypothetical protein